MDLLGGLLDKMESKPSRSRQTNEGNNSKRQGPSSGGPNPKRPASSPTSTESFPPINIVNVQLNYFQIDVSKIGRIERIHVDINVTSKKKKVFQLNGDSFSCGDIPMQFRRWALWNIFKLCVKRRPELFGNKERHSAAFDCGATVYFPEGVYCGGQQEEIQLEDNANDGHKYWGAIDKAIRVPYQLITVTLSKNKSGGMIEPSNAMEYRQALEVILSQETNTRDFFQFGNSTFNRSTDDIVYGNDPRFRSNNDMQGKEIRSGFEKSVRLLEDNVFAMSLDVKKVPFFNECSLLKFMIVDEMGDSIGRHLMGNGDVNRDDVKTIMTIFNKKQSKEKFKSTKGILVFPIHLKKKILFPVNFHDGNAMNTNFVSTVDGEPKTVSVEKYFLDHHKRKLQYPELPLVFKKRGNLMSFWPVELLKVERGQRVKTSNLTARDHASLTKSCTMLPEQHLQRQNWILFNQLKIDKSKILQAFNLTVNPKNMTTVAEIMAPPLLILGRGVPPAPAVCSMESNASTRPGIPKQFERYTFIRPAKVRGVTVISFNDVMDKKEQVQFCRNIISVGKNHGVIFEKNETQWKIEHCPHEFPLDIERIMNQAKNRNDSIVFAIAKEKKPDCHDFLKMYEATIGMQTIQISQETYQRIIGLKPGPTLEFVIRKFNLKCGGLNFHMKVPKMVNGKTICTRDMEFQGKFFKKTMYIGFDLSHASSTCLFDKQNLISSGEPSVVGMSYSLSEYTEHGGFSYLQTTRETSLLYLAKHFATAILNYANVNKTLPENILIYRAGLGEGDFPKICDEVEQIKEILRNDERILKLNKTKQIPKITMIVVQKNTHIRMYPQDFSKGNAAAQNVPAGTCVRSQMTTPDKEEFIMVTQNGMIGTARPTRYTILINEIGWTKSEIAHLTNFTAFGHQVGCAPLGVPSILHSAEEIAKRGRNNWKTDKLHSQAMKKRKDDELADTKEGVMMQALSDKLNKCTITNKNFWA